MPPLGNSTAVFLIISFSAHTRARFRGCFLAAFARCHHRFASRPRMEDEFPFLVDNNSFFINPPLPIYPPPPCPIGLQRLCFYALSSSRLHIFFLLDMDMTLCSLFYDYYLSPPHVDLLSRSDFYDLFHRPRCFLPVVCLPLSFSCCCLPAIIYIQPPNHLRRSYQTKPCILCVCTTYAASPSPSHTP